LCADIREGEREGEKKEEGRRRERGDAT